MSNHDCTGPDCASVAHEPILVPLTYTSFGEPLWPWSTED